MGGSTSIASQFVSVACVGMQADDQTLTSNGGIRRFYTAAANRSGDAHALRAAAYFGFSPYHVSNILYTSCTVA
jgi:hypothetical protein